MGVHLCASTKKVDGTYGTNARHPGIPRQTAARKGCLAKQSTDSAAVPGQMSMMHHHICSSLDVLVLDVLEADWQQCASGLSLAKLRPKTLEIHVNSSTDREGVFTPEHENSQSDT